MTDIIVKKYSDNPDAYWFLIEQFREQTFKEGNESIQFNKYDPDDENIETWLSFKDNQLISISAAERSHYTNDPNIAVRICRYHILKEHRFTHCGLIMGEHQIQWARENNFEILYVTHDITKRAINALYQRRKKMTVPSFNQHTKGEWYNSLKLERDFLFKTGDMLQYVYSIRLQDPNYVWKPKSEYIIQRTHDGKIFE
jgi:hypothetical protein